MLVLWMEQLEGLCLDARAEANEAARRRVHHGALHLSAVGPSATTTFPNPGCNPAICVAHVTAAAPTAPFNRRKPYSDSLPTAGRAVRVLTRIAQPRLWRQESKHLTRPSAVSRDRNLTLLPAQSPHSNLERW